MAYRYKFSIIVPIYNSEKTLEKCIDSVLNQSFKDFELILVNDGSIDSSGAICDRYAKSDKRVKVLHQENRGVSSARNLGIEMTEGEYMVFIDADDYVSTAYLEELSKYDEDCVICGFQKYGDSNDIYIPKENEYSGPEEMLGFIESDILSLYIRTPWAKALKRTIIESNNIRFNPEIKLGEDTLFCLEYYMQCKSIKTLHKIGYFYKAEENFCGKYKLSSDSYLKFLNNLQSILNKHYCRSIEIEKIARPVISIMRMAYNQKLMSDDFKLNVKESLQYVKKKIYKLECYSSRFEEIKACIDVLSMPYRNFVYREITSKLKSRT